ncbi:DEAD/DEAH box helicase family protein [uncultured Phocaeicola sp.]|uniref:DEAD/DEAH box helicase family protein n=1 Tax=uncultured Phocaeicola sp. TaxID=990718 RepID=UPI0025D29A38|nr:DEAD/DEAH box helicase family protein [uncultured Phocaeicola sp.]
MLKTDVIWPKSRRFMSRTDWEPLGFFSEALCNATTFDIKLGFFSSSAINVLADGFAAFLYNGGRMRMIINDVLSEEDRTAIVVGESDINTPYFDLNAIGHISYTLSKHDEHFFECLSWLIRNERIEIKIITPKIGNGIAHSKCGVFSDGINKVAFDGSCNFSKMALIENIESINAFCDWDGERDKERINDIVRDFNRTFSGEDDTVKYLKADQIITYITKTYKYKDIQELLEDERRILHRRAENSTSDSIRRVLERAKAKVTAIMDTINIRKAKVKNEQLTTLTPKFPFTEPRSYQKEAFNKWKVSQKGLFAMATGTGKTLTSLNCLLEIYNKFKYYQALILVPTITLVEQWEDECKRFNFSHIIKVSSKNNGWRSEIDDIKLKESLAQSDDLPPSFIIIATYASFSRESSFKQLMSLSKKTQRQMLLIADEAHNIGAPNVISKLDRMRILRRIGLSATPERQFDDKGNNAIMQFFGCDGKYTFEYSMKDAIDNGFLCRYKYFPHVVRLNEDEMAEYKKISLQLAKFYNVDEDTFSGADDILMRLLLKRKRIIHKAQNKEEVFRQIIKQRFEECGNLKYTLVYVPEGVQLDSTVQYATTDNPIDDADVDKLIDKYTQIIQEISPTTTVRKFVSGIQDRDEVLRKFSTGETEVLTSMKCLDEGVDVPRSELAIFCASTGNPRQFIQRRGRILRKHPDKHIAIIHDLVVAPEFDSAEENYNMERNLLKGELQRVKDFAGLSENPAFAYTELEEITNYYNLSIF